MLTEIHLSDLGVIEEAHLELGYTKPPLRNATGDQACIIQQ